MTARPAGSCTVAGCRKPAVGFVHLGGQLGESPEVYVGVSPRPNDMAVCAEHLVSVMDLRGPNQLVGQA